MIGVDNRYRYRAFLAELFIEAGEPMPEPLLQLADLIQRDRGREIVAWLQVRQALDLQELRDFRRTWHKVEVRDRRLRVLLDRMDDEIWGDDDDYDLDDAAWERKWSRTEKLRQEREDLERLLEEDPELGWYWEEVARKAGQIRAGQQRIRLAKDIAGIELIPTRRRWRDEE